MIMIGQVVISQAGRDKGHYYMVVKVLNNNHVLLVDGKMKTLEKPKKKNIKHLQKYAGRDSELTESIKSLKVKDQDIREAIKRLVPRANNRVV